MLSGKVVVVTGAGNGIGAEIAKLAAKHGAKVIVNDAGVTSAGEGRDAGVAERMVEEIRAAAPHFKAQQSGCYVHMTSTSGLIGNFGQSNYGAAKLGVAGLSKCIALDMQRFSVTSNSVAPFAWTRMVATIPETPENKKRLEVNRRLKPEKIAPLVVALASDEGRKTNGQIFGVRNNEIYLFSQPRPIRSAHTAEGWTPETVLERVLAPFQSSYFPLDRSSDVFTWDPV